MNSSQSIIGTFEARFKIRQQNKGKLEDGLAIRFSLSVRHDVALNLTLHLADFARFLPGGEYLDWTRVNEKQPVLKGPGEWIESRSPTMSEAIASSSREVPLPPPAPANTADQPSDPYARLAFAPASQAQIRDCFYKVNLEQRS